MEPVSVNPRSGNRKRWVLAIVLGLIVVAAIGALASRRLWRRGPQPGSARLDLLYAAWNEFNAKRYDQATAMLDRRAAEVAPTPLDWMLRARIAESRGELTEALAHLKKIPDSDPIGAQAWLKAGQIELARNRARAAEAAYRQSLKLDPEQIQPHRELAYLYANQLRKADCDAQFRALARRMPLGYILAFAWCQSYCRIWDPNEARKVLSRFVAEDPEDRWSRIALATSFQLTDQLDQAESVLRPLPESDPDARALRIQIAIDRGDIAAAEDLARGGPADHVRLNALRGQLALHSNQPRQAATLFRAALRQDQEDRDSIQGLGMALRTLGDPECKKYLQIAARHDRLKRLIQDSVTSLQTDTKIFDKLGELCESLDRRLEARAWYQLAIGRDPLDSQAQQALTRLDQNTEPTADPNKD